MFPLHPELRHFYKRINTDSNTGNKLGNNRGLCRSRYAPVKHQDKYQIQYDI